MMNKRISWFWIINLFLGFSFYNLSVSQARPISSHQPTAVVIGTVLCDACYQQDFSKASHFISGAIVAVECANSGKRSSFYQEVKTNKHGKFSVHLPFLVDKYVKQIKGCSVKLINSSKPHCAVASPATSSSFQLHSRKKRIHIFSAGFFTFKPVNQPKLCNQKPSSHSIYNKEVYVQKSLTSTPNDPTFSQPIQGKPSSFTTIKQGLLPPLPRLPPLPELPPLPPLPLFPPIFRSPPTSPPSTFPPFIPPPIPGLTPLSPPMSPPSIFPPFIPPPIPGLTPLSPPMSPPSIFPPIIPTPIPGLTPLPPPPPPPTFPFHLPPFPFRPISGFPGVPPATTSSPEKNNSP
ncbi:pollen-specific leucine-rich repeat extensin-like protein 3 [Nicotiana tomentosiformis]|uniref:pollen-specific leucine-rich repeat extensin-like protein 3 n=1 Tax=Nicotiana tomentosiformis TaxID=4098 RepID=UPI00051C5179|nr:proline-rich extensin-like protein EPR1 [Nicotiana tomentosiformis]